MAKTKYEDIGQRTALPPIISETALRSVSQYRREGLEDQVSNGLFREANNSGATTFANNNLKTKLGAVTYSTTKVASADASTTGNYRGSGSTVRMNPDVYSPLWLNSNLNMPRKREQINAWCRAYYATNPFVKNALSLHSTYPISKLSITCKNQKVQDFFNDMIEETDLMNICVQAAQEFWVIGEVFIYGEMDASAKKWSRFIIQNPDHIHVENSVIASDPSISIKPDENLKRIVTSNRPFDILQRKKMDKSIIEHIKRNENIPMNNLYVSHLANKVNPYDPRGTSLIVSIFKQLMLFDILRENRYVQADSMINPLTLVKIGSADYKPTPEDLEGYRRVFEEGTYDKNFKIFTHDAVTVEKISNNAIIDDSTLVTQIVKEMYIGLMVPNVIMDGGGDITYQNGGVALDVLKQRYMQFRNMLSSWLKRKVFAPISHINDFYEYEDGKKKLIIPDVEWNHMSLFDMTDYITVIKDLVVADPPIVPISVLYRSLGLDEKDNQYKLKQERIQKAIVIREASALDAMTLDQLRSLQPEEEITESVETPKPLPGEGSPDGGGMGDLGGGMNSLPGMGDSPDMGGPSLSSPNMPSPPDAL